ncbi:p2Y purinoceptor 4 [Elysia marginata]|uniref:P2Y purinoceptor 4 n=1 Tax=Elysia marginata TaxID=1093978 RepID=A0AAV4EGP4_9GAST|nr:p2Y purinoceptor 4 [Elysia marginata]
MWGWHFKVITYHLVVAVGLAVNSLTFILMKTPRLKSKSYSHYLSALAVFDSLVLISQEIHIINEILTRGFHQRGIFEEFSDEACKILNFCDSVCNLMSAWLIVVMALERLWVVSTPFRRTATIWFRQKGAIIIILSLIAVLSATQVFRFEMVGKTGSTCMGSGPLYVSLHLYLYQFVLHSTLPILIVFVANVGVVTQIVKVERATHGEESSSTRLTGGNSRQRSKTTRMMIYISLTYILTSVPLVSLTIFLHVLVKQYGRAASGIFIRSLPWLDALQVLTLKPRTYLSSPATETNRATVMLIQCEKRLSDHTNSSDQVLASLNYASNFFIYILSGKKFRIELGQLLSCKQRRNHQVTNINTRSGSVRTKDEILLTNMT